MSIMDRVYGVQGPLGDTRFPFLWGWGRMEIRSLPWDLDSYPSLRTLRGQTLLVQEHLSFLPESKPMFWRWLTLPLNMKEESTSLGSFVFGQASGLAGVLVSWPGIWNLGLAVKVASPNHWTPREFPARLGSWSDVVKGKSRETEVWENEGETVKANLFQKVWGGEVQSRSTMLTLSSHLAPPLALPSHLHNREVSAY